MAEAKVDVSVEKKDRNIAHILEDILLEIKKNQIDNNGNSRIASTLLGKMIMLLEEPQYEDIELSEEPEHVLESIPEEKLLKPRKQANTKKIVKILEEQIKESDSESDPDSDEKPKKKKPAKKIEKKKKGKK